MLASAEGASGKKFGVFYVGFTQKWPGAPLLRQKVHKTSILRVLRGHGSRATWFWRAPPKPAKDVRERRRRERRKVAAFYPRFMQMCSFEALRLANNAHDEQYIEVAPKSLIHESIHGDRAPLEQSENDTRERRRRERRKFGASYASFTQKWLLRHCT